MLEELQLELDKELNLSLSPLTRPLTHIFLLFGTFDNIDDISFFDWQIQKEIRH